jgi:nucleotide-binding universal stress UspA family protein
LFVLAIAGGDVINWFEELFSFVGGLSALPYLPLNSIYIERSPFMAYKNIVCGVTGSEPSQKAAQEAARLAKENQAGLTYVYAVDAKFLKGMTIQLTSDFAEKTLEHLGGHILERAEESARDLGATSRKIIRSGAVLEVLKQVIAEEKADLLVLGHEDRSFFEKILFGGEVEDHVQELIKQTGVNVLVVK